MPDSGALSSSVDENTFRQKLKNRTMVYMGRVHPKKNLEHLINCFVKSELSSSWRLLIVGAPQDKRYHQILKEIALTLKCNQRISFIDFLRGREKDELLSSATITVLPSHSENFGVVVVEALSRYTPCIASKGTPWSELIDTGSGFWVDCSAHNTELIETMDFINKLDIYKYAKLCENARLYLKDTGGRLLRCR